MAPRTFMRFPGGLAKALTLSYDDGVVQDKRFIEIIDKYGLKATFNINSGLFSPENEIKGRRMSRSMVMELYANSPHEVAVHAYTHARLETLPPLCVAKEILDDRTELEAMFDKTIRGMAYPYGTYNDTVVEVLKNSGIAYSRTTQSTKKFDIPTDWLRMPATCHHKAPELMQLAEKFIAAKTDVKPHLFYLWGHTYEFDDNDNWNIIEEFAEYMGNRDDVWYATNIEIYDYVQAYNNLIWSAALDRVENPSAIPVWVSVARHKESANTFVVEPGKAVKF